MGLRTGVCWGLPAALWLGMGLSGAAQSGPVGLFEGQSDVGRVTPPGTANFHVGTYTITSAGQDLWGANDDFHFVWKKVSGDVALTAEMKLAVGEPSAHFHRKAMLMFRQSLDTDAMYADAALHGDDETALQYRREKGAATQDIAFNIGAPKLVRLEKRGDVVTLFVSLDGGTWRQVGASTRVHLEGAFYAGLGVCAHNATVPAKATFAHVELKALEPVRAPGEKTLYSTLETIAIPENGRMAFSILTGKGHMEAPNWSRDGKALLFNRDGKMWTVPVEVGEGRALDISEAKPIDIGDATDCTGSHGLSPDGKMLAITCVTPGHPGRRVYLAPSAGGAPKMLTENPNSYFHSWSPDGKTILFTRPVKGGGGNILAIPVEGGAEKELTTGTGLSDDPDFSPDGQWIYFNSDRAGGMQIFRMRPDGSGAEQVTHDDMRNWTPHPSPDGHSVLILSYPKEVTGHPANKDVELRILDAATGKMRDLVGIVGGSGTDNVNNWAPDGSHFAFVSYQMLPENANGSTE